MSCSRAFAKGEQNKGGSKNPAGAKRYFWDTKISLLSALQILRLPTRQASSSKGCKAIYQTSISEGINTWADAKKMLKRQSGWAKRHRGRAGEASRGQRDSQRYKESPDGTESVRRCLCERVGGESDSAETLGRDTRQRLCWMKQERRTPAHLHCPAAAATSATPAAPPPIHPTTVNTNDWLQRYQSALQNRPGGGAEATPRQLSLFFFPFSFFSC